MRAVVNSINSHSKRTTKKIQTRISTLSAERISVVSKQVETRKSIVELNREFAVNKIHIDSEKSELRLRAKS